LLKKILPLFYQISL